MSLENYAEQIEILLLQAQSALSTVSIVRQDEDAHAAKDRIVVKAMPREVLLAGKDPTSVQFWTIPVVVSIHLVTRNAALMDTYIAAVELANNSAPAGAAVTLATAQFAGGLQIENTDAGTRDSSENERQHEKTFNFIAKA